MLAHFINMVMKSGKKSVAESIVYGALDAIGEKNAEPVGAGREGARATSSRRSK